MATTLGRLGKKNNHFVLQSFTKSPTKSYDDVWQTMSRHVYTTNTPQQDQEDYGAVPRSMTNAMADVGGTFMARTWTA